MHKRNPKSDLKTMISDAALFIAMAEVGVTENPPGSNRGDQVDEYIRSVGLNPEKGSYPWCAAFVSWCIQLAEGRLKMKSGLPRSARVVDYLDFSEPMDKLKDDVVEGPGWIKGSLFLLHYKSLGRVGHIGFVYGLSDRVGYLDTIEGNTDNSGSRLGLSVCRRTRRIGEIHSLVIY